jgi:hypothetical protein
MGRRGTALTVLGLALVAFLVAFSTAGALHSPITQAQSGKTYHLSKSGTATLHLSERWAWSTPAVSSRVVGLTQFQYLVDPGYTGWTVSPRTRGTATITSLGKPACANCGLAVRHFRVKMVVGS